MLDGIERDRPHCPSVSVPGPLSDLAPPPKPDPSVEVIQVVFQNIGGGWIHVESNDVPGLFLSGLNREELESDLKLAIPHLLKENCKLSVTVESYHDAEMSNGFTREYRLRVAA